MDTDPLAGVLPGTTTNADADAPQGFNVAGSAGIAIGSGTGTYGFGTIAGGTGKVGTAIEEVWDWLQTPFTTPLSAIDMFLIVGTIMVAIILWNLILYHIRVAAEEI